MDLEQFREHVRRGEPIVVGSEALDLMNASAQDALRIGAELNHGYRSPSEIRELLSELTGRGVDESVTLFPPFYCEFGKNLVLEPGVFLNMACRFQDTGGITIGEGSLIGHGTTIVTLNHAVDPDHRGDLLPAPVTLGRRVWVGAAATIVPGVSIGDGAIIGAGAVVTKDVAPHTIVAGVPARLIRETGFGPSAR